MNLDLNNIENILDEVLGRLFKPALGSKYKFSKSEVEETEALGKYVVANFKNETVSRNLSIAYLPKLNERKDVLMIHVENGGNDTFNIKEYLKHSGIVYSDSDFDISSYNGDLSTRLDKVLNVNLNAINEHMSEIISGKVWVNIPFDWQGYK